METLKCIRRGIRNNSVYQYSLSTAWQVSTATYDNVSLFVTTPILAKIIVGCAIFNPDGTNAVYGWE